MTRIYRDQEVLWRTEEDALAEAHLKLASGADITELGTSILLAEGQIVGLNLLGTEIWKICDGRNIEEIVTELLDRFEVTAATLRTDVEGFLAELAAKGLVRYGE
jgi:GeoRSP system PqqD family protein